MILHIEARDEVSCVVSIATVLLWEACALRAARGARLFSCIGSFGMKCRVLEACAMHTYARAWPTAPGAAAEAICGSRAIPVSAAPCFACSPTSHFPTGRCLEV